MISRKHKNDSGQMLIRQILKTSHCLCANGACVSMNTLKEEIFAGIDFREFFFGHFAGINLLQIVFTEDFAGINL